MYYNLIVHCLFLYRKNTLRLLKKHLVLLPDDALPDKISSKFKKL
ncbi:hypothetical protein EAKF1_ch1763 [Escherichia albertii KF1]|nr:hypothetical protein EAKF1_ch1763 [Escherichia albertii KF1]